MAALSALHGSFDISFVHQDPNEGMDDTEPASFPDATLIAPRGQRPQRPRFFQLWRAISGWE